MSHADHPSEQPPARTGTVSRRTLLAGGAVLLAGAGGGAVGLMVGGPRPVRRPQPAPAWLVAAIGRESALIAGLDLAVTDVADATLRSRIAAIRADHAAHLQALRALAGPALPAESTAPAARTAPAPPSAGPSTPAQLLAAEQAAARAARMASATLTGRDAVLLASIAASESAHAVVLT